MEEKQLFRIITRGGSSPRFKPRVYFCCADEDLSSLERVAAFILEKHNCAVFIRNREAAAAEREDMLRTMQLFVIPITSAFLRPGCAARETELPFAGAHSIQVLPIVMESGTGELFSRSCGKMQYLDRDESDGTGLSFEEKLEKRLDGALLGDELAKRVAGAFRANVFLSYRKKDRRFADEVIQLMRSRSELLDVAVWYDEFLTPGEAFDSAILERLTDSDLFALLVTPNIVAPAADGGDNYVVREEYPLAVKYGKPILPIKAAPIDRTELENKFPHIGECCPPEALTEELGKLLPDKKSSMPQAERLYLIGLAYLNGYGAIKNTKLGKVLMTDAANAGNPEAMKKLAELYRFGGFGSPDITKVIAWQEKYADACKMKYSAAPCEKTALELADAYSELGWACRDALRPNDSREYMELSGSLLEQISDRSDSPELHYRLAYNYWQRAWIEKDAKHIESAKRHYSAAIGELKALAGKNVFSYGASLMNVYNDYGIMLKDEGEYEFALNNYLKALEFGEPFACMLPEAFDFAIANLCNNLQVVCRRLGRCEDALIYGEKGEKLVRVLAEEDPTLYMPYLAKVLSNKSLAYKAMQLYENAYREGMDALDIRNALFEKNPELYKSDLAESHGNLTNILRDAGYYSSAEDHGVRTIELFTELARHDPMRYLEKLKKAYENVLLIYYNQSRFGMMCGCAFTGMTEMIDLGKAALGYAVVLTDRMLGFIVDGYRLGGEALAEVYKSGLILHFNFLASCWTEGTLNDADTASRIMLDGKRLAEFCYAHGEPKTAEAYEGLLRIWFG